MNNLREKVGELFMVGYAGTDPRAARDLIQLHRVGGMILFTRNIKDASHARSVCKSLQEMREEVSDTPLFIAVDQEGGCVARITEGVTVFPGNMALGATQSEALARQVGSVTAHELASLGINVNFAPVLDLSTNPHNPGLGARSFGADPLLASRLGASMIEGMQKEGVCATAKHFPGLGEARVDSHDELPIVALSKARLEQVELAPFRAVIAAGVDFVMTAHCSFPALDDSLAPATLSSRILTQLLRKELGFNGVIITDCLEMGAVEKLHPASESAVRALRVGADMVLICHTLEKQLAAMEAVVRAVKEGTISEERIEEASHHVKSLKQRLPSFAGRPYVSQKELSEKIAAQAVTLVQNQGGFIPLRLKPAQRLAVVTPAFELLTKVEDTGQHCALFIKELQHFHPNLTHCEISVRPKPEETSRAVEKCKAADVLILLTYNLHLNPEQLECVQTLVNLGKPAVVAAVRDPHDLALINGAEAYLATYSFRECSLKALARVIFGETRPEGILPVKI